MESREEDVCDAFPEVLVYRMQMEWIGLDGRTFINNSVRIEWSETDSRAVCEVPKKMVESKPFLFANDPELSLHCSRCMVQVLAFATLFLLLLRGLGVHTVRTLPFQASPCATLPLPECRELPRAAHTSCKVVPPPRRCKSAAGILEARFHLPFVAARWAFLCECSASWTV